jgi:hypothetical protein
MNAEARRRMPPRVLPWLYFAFAYGSLLTAFGAIAWDPRGVAGFFYHARMVGIVHLVTLGWITSSILGALYLVAPLALRTPLPARRGDAIAFASFTIGVIGMVAHFWIEEFGGMAWSGMMVAAGILHVGWRVISGMRRAPIPGAIKWHLALAFVNIAIAAAVGVLLGFDKVYHFLPGFVLSNVVAHAHFAAIGWASLMVVGVGYRMLPMVLPSGIPQGRTLYASAVLLETGAVGLFVALLLRSRWTGVFALVAVAGFGAFAAHALVMLRRRRTPAPVWLGTPATGHAMASFVFLGVTILLGVWLAFAAASEVTLRAAMAYGVFGLLGFLAQMVVAMQGYLLRLLAWFSAAHAAEDLSDVTLPDLPGRRRRVLAWLLWIWGVPAIAAGFFVNGIPLVTAGALALEAATVLAALQAARAARHAFAPIARLSSVHDGERGRPASGKSALQAARP